jgi:branched-chain amino acid aminotransferase
MLTCYYNGQWLPNDSIPLSADSRTLRFGEGLFETFPANANGPVLFDEHMNRLWKGMQDLAFQIPKLLSPESIRETIARLMQKNKLTKARIRVTVMRGPGGLFDPVSLAPDLLIQSWPLPDSSGLLNENGLVLDIYPDARKAYDRFSSLKHNNFLPYALGALYAKAHQCNDAIILNAQDRIADTCMANLFMIQANEIITPPLTEACIAGILRKEWIQWLRASGYSIAEKPIPVAALLEADEIFVTNSIFPMRWAGRIAEKTYSNLQIREIYRAFRQTKPDCFC